MRLIYTHAFYLIFALALVIIPTKGFGALFTIDDPSDCDLTVLVPDDFHICFDDEFNLGGIIIGDYDDYIWFENGDDTNYDLNEEISISETTTFTLVAQYQSEENIIINGDFESGDSDFTTDYVLGTTSCFGLGNLDCEGTYDVIDDPSDGHANFAACSDVVGGGNMMVVNGAASLQQIWCQDVCIEPGATYVFSAWAASVNPGSPAQLQFAIDGELIGSLFSLGSTTCDWEEFEAEWTSSSETTVEICVTNQNTAASGNDFALDGIGFVRICEDEASFTVTHSEFETEFNNPLDLTCVNTESEIVITVTPTNDYTYDWTSDDGNIIDYENDNQVVIVDAQGVYTVTVTDMFGCSKEFEIEVEEDIEYPELTIESSNDLDCNMATTELEVDANFGGVDFEWFNSDFEFISDDNSIEVSEEGLYYVLAFDDDTGCETLDSILVSENFEDVVFDIVSSNNLDCNNLSAVLSVDIPSETIMWSSLDSINLGNSNSITVNQAGTYSAFIILDNGCTATDTINISETNPNFNFNIEYDSLINCDALTANVTVDLDLMLYNFQWQTNGLEEVAPLVYETSQGGTYYYEIIDTLNCALIDSIVIIENTIPPVVELTIDSITCSDPIANLSIANPNDILLITWILPDTTTITSDSINLTTEGPVKFIVKAQNSCIVEGEYIVLSNESVPDVSIEGDTITCLKPSASLSINANQSNLSYDWLLPDGTSSNAIELQTDQTGIHTLTATNEMGCQAFALYPVIIDTLKPEIFIQDSLVLDCYNPILNGNIQISNITDEIITIGDWFDPNDFSFSIDEPGEYSLQVVGQNGCSQSAIISTIIDTLSPIITYSNIQSLDCNIEAFDLVIQIENEYETLIWNNNIIPNENLIQTITNGGIYTTTAVAPNGCQSEAIIEILASDEIPQFEVNATVIDCINPFSSVTIDISNNYESINILSNSTNLSNSTMFETQETDTIYIEVINELGCSQTESLVIEFDTISPQFSLSANVLTCNEPITLISIISQDEISSTEVLNDQGLLIGDINSPIDSEGNYSVICSSPNGCTYTENIDIIKVTDTPKIEFFKTEDQICQIGLIISDLQISGGSPPYTLKVDGNIQPNPSNTFELINEGEHIIKIEDSNGCVTDTVITVNPILPVTSDLSPEVTINEGDSFQFNLDLNKPIDEIDIIEWTPPIFLDCYDCTTPVYSGTEDITYNVYVRDSSGCETTTEVRVNININVRYFIPNVIALDAVGNNKFTIFDNRGDISNVEKLNIYDRWGNLVFTNKDFLPNDPDSGWDGRYNNSIAEGGVYVYHFILKLRTGEIVNESGDVTFIK